jgi:hypothetical protein
MQESRQLRRAQRAEAIKRQQHLLYVMKLAEDKVPKSIKDRHTGRIQEITKDLHEWKSSFTSLTCSKFVKN